MSRRARPRPRIHAPDLPTDATWLNVARPLTPADLRGRVVVLDFWTYACINCLHTLPVLSAAEAALVDEPVVVIGVHSPKFPAEADAALVCEAIRRYGITHPVVVDPGKAIWDAYAVRSWPTLVLLRPDGTIAGQAAGEPDLEPLLSAIRAVLAEQPDRLLRDARGGPGIPARPEPAAAGVLAFPGGLALAGSSALLVADTGHHQILVCGLDGRERWRIGSGTPGLVDGPAGSARLHHPRGLAVDGDVAWVADTGNHAVRRVDLSTGTVTTAAGTGRRGRGSVPGPALATDLRSPWDVAVGPGGEVVLAMAGSHQLWAVAGGQARVLAGTGREGRRDGPLGVAAFAQPSGLAATADGALHVADSEISAVRRVAGGAVSTLAGGDLFDFGLVDGPGEVARFQHPVGIAAAVGGALDGLLLVADTLNHAVRAVDPATGDVRTLAGDGTPFDAALALLERRSPVPVDARAGPALREPEAVVWDGTRILVADTDNHRVVAVDPGSGAVEVVVGAA